MKYTKDSVAEEVKNKYEPVQIDGIPEGFSFKAPTLKIGIKEYEGDYYIFIPLTTHSFSFNAETSEQSIVNEYNKAIKQRNKENPQYAQTNS